MTLLQSNTVRRPRFTRAAPLPIRLTPDDLAILLHVAKHRFLRSTHLVWLLPERSEKKLIERLGTLFHNGYLDRPPAQLDYYATGGSAPMVYALGSRGALALSGRTTDDRSSLDWTSKNRGVGKLFIEHALLIADMMVAGEHTARVHPRMKLIEMDDVAAVKLTAPVMMNGRRHELTVVPDKVFGFEIGGKRKYFFVEADRATMPITRRDLNQTSYSRKLLAYVAGGGKLNLFGRQFGIDNFRVLSVTTSNDRMTSMIDALRVATNRKGSQQFLFLDRSTLCANPDMFAVEWATGKGDRVRLCD
jgi:hypothetical protein